MKSRGKIKGKASALAEGKIVMRREFKADVDIVEIYVVEVSAD